MDAIKSVYPLWKSLRIVHEMLTDRGYTHTEEWEQYGECTPEDFARIHFDTLDDAESTRKNLRFIYMKNGKADMTVFWKNSLGTGDIQEIHGIMKEDNVTKAVVIYNTKITPNAAVALRHLRTQKIIIETFSEAEMQYNLTKHEDVPRHIICSAAKKIDVLEKYSITQEQLPKIKSTDPVCRYYGAVKGQLIKIVRQSDCTPAVVIAGKSKILFDINYRIVV